MLSAAVRQGMRLLFWKTRPRGGGWGGGVCQTIWPLVGWRRLAIKRSRVDLPTPEGPIMVTNVPWLMVLLILWSACVPSGKV